MFYMFLTFMSIDPQTRFFMYYFKLQKLEFKKLIDDTSINIWSFQKFSSTENIQR